MLIAVGTVERRVEILTADWIRERIPDEACEAAIDAMRPDLVAGHYDSALVKAVEHLAHVAGAGRPKVGGVELPDLFDER